MSFPTTNYGFPYGNDNSTTTSASESSVTPYTDFVYGQIAHSTQQLYPELEEGFLEEGGQNQGTQGRFSIYPELNEYEGDDLEFAGTGVLYPSPTQLVEDDGDADTVVGDTVVGVVEDDECEDSDDDEDGTDFVPVDYRELRATVADPLRRELVANWQNDLESLPAGYVTEWLQEGGPRALINATGAKFEAVMGFPREFMALETSIGPDGRPFTVRDTAKFYQMVQGLWDVKVRTASVIFARTNYGSHKRGGSDKTDRRRKLLLAGQSYWIHPTPLRQVSLPGTEEEIDDLEESSECDQGESLLISIEEDEITEMDMRAGQEDMTLDAAHSSQFERIDEDLTHGDAFMSLEEQQTLDSEAIIDPKLRHDLKLLAQAYDDYQVYGDMSKTPPFSLDLLAEGRRDPVTEPANEFSSIDPLWLDLQSEGDMAGFDDPPGIEVVARDPASAIEPLPSSYHQTAADTAPRTEEDGYVNPHEAVGDDDVASGVQVADFPAYNSTRQGGGSILSGAVHMANTHNFVGGLEYKTVDRGEAVNGEVNSDTVVSGFDLKLKNRPYLDPMPVELEIGRENIDNARQGLAARNPLLPDDDPAGVSSRSSDHNFKAVSDVSRGEDVEDHPSEPVHDAAVGVMTSVLAEIAADRAWRAMGDLYKITNAEHIAISDPSNLDVEEQIFHTEMETAYMRQVTEDRRQGRCRVLFVADEADPTNNWGYYWQRGEARALGAVL